MPDTVYYIKCKNIKKVMNDLSIALNIDRKELSSIESKLKTIILGANNHTLEDMLEKYFNMLKNEMTNMIVEKFTPGFQFGIKNKHISVIGFYGKFNGREDSKDIEYNTYFSFDSISKILTSIITMLLIRDGKFTFDTLIKDINPEFSLDASIKDIMHFTSNIKTDKRLEGLSRDETIELLKKCRDLVELKQPNFYQYTDIGHMILRCAMPGFMEKIDTVLNLIDPFNLTYENTEYIGRVTGGRLGNEHFTPDLKGRCISFPGHTGLYGNIRGLLNFFEKVSRDSILTNEELELLLKQPYENPIIYNSLGEPVYKNQRILCTGKLAGFYIKPNNIPSGEEYDYMLSCDFPKLTTSQVRSSTGTSGSYALNDNLGSLGCYTAGILTNPYSCVEDVRYPNDIYTKSQNPIKGFNINVDERGVVLGHYKKLEKYRAILAEYGILLNLITEYYKNIDSSSLEVIRHSTYVRKLTNPSNN